MSLIPVSWARALLGCVGRGPPKVGAPGAGKDWVPLAVIIPADMDECLLCAGAVSMFNLQPDELRSPVFIPTLQVRAHAQRS